MLEFAEYTTSFEGIYKRLPPEFRLKPTMWKTIMVPLVLSYSCCYVLYSKAHGGRTGADDMMLQENIRLTRNQLDQCLNARRRYRTRTRNQITAKVCMEDLISSLCDEQTLPGDSSLLDSGKNELFYRCT